jgi:hypothetical protein
MTLWRIVHSPLDANHDLCRAHKPSTINSATNPELLSHNTLLQAHLLLAFGADATVTEDQGETPQQVAATEEHTELAAWFGAVAGWSSLRVAAGCRMVLSIFDMVLLYALSTI